MNHLEDILQEAVAEFLTVALTGETVFYHVPNGGSRNIVEAVKLRRMGTLAGVPDINIVHDSRVYFIELKAPKGSVSKVQKALHTRLTAAGCPVAICRSIPEVQGALAAWNIPTRVAG